jgi:GNAT superfamily N-acetyltransferase
MNKPSAILIADVLIIQSKENMPDSFVIRAIEKTDYAGWEKLWNAYNQFYGRSGATALPVEITQTTWSRFFDADEPVNALVAEGPSGLVGLVHFIYHRSTIQVGLSCYLQDLFTAEEARGQGVARGLIEAVYQHALSSGSPRVYWQTHETNLGAMKLYDRVADKSGFIVYRKMLDPVK